MSPVYAKKLNDAQREMLRRYESVSGFEPMHQDEFDAGEMTFSEMWYANVQWLEDVVADATSYMPWEAFEADWEAKDKRSLRARESTS